MNWNSILWLAAGILCFGFGLAGGRSWDQSAKVSATPAGDGAKPLGSAISSPKTTEPADENSRLSKRITNAQQIAAAELSDLPELVRQLMSERREPSDLSHLTPAIERWVELDPAGGFAFFAAEFTSREDNFCLSMYSHHWARIDPESALEAVTELGQDDRVSLCLSNLGVAIAQEHPAEFLRLYDRLGRNKHFSLPQVAQQLTQTDPQAVIEFLPNLDDDARRGVSGDIGFAWAKKDPEGALEWARGLDDERARTRALHAIASRMIETDPAKAASIYLEGGEPGNDDAGSVNSGGYFGESFSWSDSARKLARTDPVAAFEWSRNFTEKENAHLWVTRFLPHSASATIDYIANLPGGVFATESHEVPDSWRPRDLEEGFAKLEEIADPRARETAHAWLLAEQAHDDPQKAIETARNEIASEGRRVPIMANALTSWVSTDPEAASSWLTEQEPGDDLDAGVASLVDAIRISDPDAAIRWASTIDNHEMRNRYLSKVLGEQPAAWSRAAFAELESQLDLNEQDRKQFSRFVTPPTETPSP